MLGIEVTVLAIGWMLGGTVGFGTILYALTIGPIVHWCISFFTIQSVCPQQVSSVAPDPR